MASHRPCERQCVECGRWKHYSKFRTWKELRCVNESQIRFAKKCKACEQKIRNEKKNADRPRWIIEGRARAAAAKMGKSFEFVWVEMNYQALVPMYRAMLTPEARCLNCGHAFTDEADIQIEHREAPRSNIDFARLHTRNLGFFCNSCNGTKSNKAFADWLDEQEEVRLSNLKQPSHKMPTQIEMF